MFYSYNQNNSFGTFDFDFEQGISCLVVVEADNSREANRQAESIGLYFDGDGDCPCCGDRWSSVWDEDGTEKPCYYITELTTTVDDKSKPGTNKSIYAKTYAFVHYADGRVVGYERPTD